MLVKSKTNIKQVLEKIHNLPALPAIADEAMRILNDKDSSKNDVVKIISKEQSFISKILAIANSPIYGLRKEVSTLSFAVFVLGLKEIKKVVFALAFLESFKMVKDNHFNPEAFWLHSFVVGNLSRKIALDLDIMNSGEAFIAGFLHDFSVSVIHRDFKSEFVEIHEVVSNGATFTYAEKELLGLSHTEISKIVLDNWSFPDILVDAIVNHHKPSLANYDKELTAVVHLADYITNTFEIANCSWDKDFEIDESVIETLHFSNMDSLTEFTEKYREFINEQIASIRNLV